MLTKQEKVLHSKHSALHDFIDGSKQSLPIALGYFPVSFTFGLMAVKGGIPVWIVILISMTNLTSAGQFAGTNLIIAGAGLAEITITTFVINIRYMLMSLSLSQKIVEGIPGYKRWIMSFGITDETFTVAAMQKKDITFSYMTGLEVLLYRVGGRYCSGCYSVYHTARIFTKFNGYCFICNVYCACNPGSKEIKSCSDCGRLCYIYKLSNKMGTCLFSCIRWMENNYSHIYCMYNRCKAFSNGGYGK